MAMMTDRLMKQYYEFRKEIHKLYDHDVYNTGDLCSGILEIRDKEKCIESIKIDLSHYSIDLELSQNTSESKTLQIIDKITNSIGRYILNNKNQLDSEIINNDNFETYLISPSHPFCDTIIIGNSVTFNL